MEEKLSPALKTVGVCLASNEDDHSLHYGSFGAVLAVQLPCLLLYAWTRTVFGICQKLETGGPLHQRYYTDYPQGDGHTVE